MYSEDSGSSLYTRIHITTHARPMKALRLKLRCSLSHKDFFLMKGHYSSGDALPPLSVDYLTSLADLSGSASSVVAPGLYVI